MEDTSALGPFPPPEKRPRPSIGSDDALESLLPPTDVLNLEGEGFKSLNETIASVVNKVEQASVTEKIQRLINFPTRHTLSPHNVEAANWLLEEFKSFGYEDVKLHDFKVGGQTRHNIVCTKHGSSSNEKFVIVCAHYDSRGKKLADFNSTAPGAVDNASGVSVLLEAARVIKDIDVGSSVRFLAFSGEEQGLVGSAAYAGAAKSTGTDIILVINLDMVGHPVDTEKRTIVIERDVGNATAENDAASNQFATQMGQLAGLYTSLKVKWDTIYDSDYMPFESLGYVCIGAFDGSNSASFYHTADDTIDKVDTSFCAEVARMVVATVFTVAGRN